MAIIYPKFVGAGRTNLSLSGPERTLSEENLSVWQL